MEALESNAIVSLHPRRFGKSLFISMLQEYYDLHNKHSLKELFKGLYAENNLTPKAGSFLVLALDFSGLKTNGNIAEFEQDFNEKNNGALNDFLVKYQSQLQLASFTLSTDFARNFTTTYRHALRQGFKVTEIIIILLILPISVICND